MRDSGVLSFEHSKLADQILFVGPSQSKFQDDRGLAAMWTPHVEGDLGTQARDPSDFQSHHQKHVSNKHRFNSDEPSSSREEYTKFIRGVAIYNYHTRGLRKEGFASDNSTSTNASDWIVYFLDNCTDDDIISFCRHISCLDRGHPSEGGIPYADIRGTENDIWAALGNASSKDCVRFIEPDSEFSTLNPVEATAATLHANGTGPVPWNLDRINQRDLPLDGHTQNRSYVGTGSGVHVFVLDTGIRTTHEQFESRASQGICTICIPEQTCTPANQNCASDGNGHGTHCAGTVGGKDVGIAKDAILHAVKVLKDDGTGRVSAIPAALDWVLQQQNKRPAVVSLSLQIESPTGQVIQSWTRALNKTVAAGITVVVAAGNSNSDACNNLPTMVPEVISVGATTSSDERADFSNWGSCVDIFAPGKDIRSAAHDNDVDLAISSGTSMACPLVVGVVALLLQRDYRLTPMEVRQQLMAAATENKIHGLLGGPNKLLFMSKSYLDTLPTAPPILHLSASPAGPGALPTSHPGFAIGIVVTVIVLLISCALCYRLYNLRAKGLQRSTTRKIRKTTSSKTMERVTAAFRSSMAGIADATASLQPSRFSAYVIGRGSQVSMQQRSRERELEVKRSGSNSYSSEGSQVTASSGFSKPCRGSQARMSTNVSAQASFAHHSTWWREEDVVAPRYSQSTTVWNHSHLRASIHACEELGATLDALEDEQPHDCITPKSQVVEAMCLSKSKSKSKDLDSTPKGALVLPPIEELDEPNYFSEIPDTLETPLSAPFPLLQDSEPSSKASRDTKTESGSTFGFGHVGIPEEDDLDIGVPKAQMEAQMSQLEEKVKELKETTRQLKRLRPSEAPQVRSSEAQQVSTFTVQLQIPLGVKTCPELNCLKVTAVTAGRGVAAYNLQAEPEKQIVVGDYIVKINGVSGDETMLQEIKTIKGEVAVVINKNEKVKAASKTPGKKKKAVMKRKPKKGANASKEPRVSQDEPEGAGEDSPQRLCSQLDSPSNKKVATKCPSNSNIETIAQESAKDVKLTIPVDETSGQTHDDFFTYLSADE